MSMTTYIARLIADHQLVGIFTVEHDGELFWLVDECCDPGAVELSELGTGGIFWASSDAPAIPAAMDEDGEAGFEGVPEGAQPSEAWRPAFFDFGEEPVWKPVPRP
jgi:hypothetical protein